MVTNIDEDKLEIIVDVCNGKTDDVIIIDVKDRNVKIKTIKVKEDFNKKISIKIPDIKLWSPNLPFLYDLTIKIERDGNLYTTNDGGINWKKCCPKTRPTIDQFILPYETMEHLRNGC